MINSIIKRIARKLLQEKPVGFLERLSAEIHDFKTVFDIGAYHGNFTDEIIRKNNQVTVHCFEPFNVSFKILTDKYQLSNNIVLNHCAVSDKPGKSFFNINSFAETNSLMESVDVNEAINALTKKETTQEVDLITVTEYCRLNNINEIDLVKIDTQGNSFNVLVGMESLLKKQKVKYLYVETEFIEIYKNEKLFSEIEILMRGFGYSIVDLYNFNYINDGQLAWCDVLFAKRN